MAQVYVTGCCDIFVETGLTSQGGPVFLGHCEKTPGVQIRRHHSPVFCDYSGRAVPADMIYEGESALVSLDLTRYNEDIYALLARSTGFGSFGERGGGARGTDEMGDIGSLMQRDRRTRELWLRFPYGGAGGKPTMNLPRGTTGGGAMVSGMHFLSAYLEGPDDLGPLSTAARRLHIVFHCLRRWVGWYAGSRNNAPAPVLVPNETLLLYDHSMAAVTGLVGA